MPHARKKRNLKGLCGFGSLVHLLLNAQASRFGLEVDKRNDWLCPKSAWSFVVELNGVKPIDKNSKTMEITYTRN